MGQMIRCPLTNESCNKSITIQEKTFFLAETEKPPEERKRREQAISLSLGEEYQVRNALDEKQPYAFTCKICEMIQECSYGIVDISSKNPNVILELGVMIALGKPTIILLKCEHDKELDLFSDLKAIEVIPFIEYIDIVEQLKELARKLPPSLHPATPTESLQKLDPKITEELRQQFNDVISQFKEAMEKVKLDTIPVKDEKKVIPPEINARIEKLEENIKNLSNLGFAPDFRTAFLRGNLYYNQGKYLEAKQAYDLSLKLRPDHPDTLTNRGVTYDDMGKYEEALKDYNRSLELRPDHPATLTNRGATYDDMEKYPEALADYNRSLEIRPDDPDTLYNRGNTYSTMEKYPEALADYNCSLKIRPDDAGTLYNIACLYSLWKKPDDAFAFLEKAIGKDKKYREKARTDKDFDNIRNDPRFKKLTGQE
ncbi:MAG: tetratricopeptide repeat protein [Chloroflexota bacterium]